MRKLTKATFPVALAAVAAFAMAPAVHAQDTGTKAEAEQNACTAQVNPASIQAGQKAVQVQATLSQSVGAITSVDAGESGLELAAASDLPKSEMSRSETDAEPQPIQMAAEGNSATLWFNTANAKPGQQHLTLKGEQGDCTAQVTVEGADDTSGGSK